MENSYCKNIRQSVKNNGFIPQIINRIISLYESRGDYGRIWFVYYLNNERNIEEFVDAIVKMLKVNRYEVNLNKDTIIENYRNKLKELGTEDMINYYVLTANIVADELRKYNIELIDLFDRFSNYNYAIIHNNNIQKLKKLEERIKC